MTDTLPALPALKHLGELSEARPVIVVDTREQDPLPIRRLPVIRGTLYSADYSINGLQEVFGVERKSLDDLAACCVNSNRNRFEHELHRLRGFRFKRLLIIGTQAQVMAGQYVSRIKPAAIFGTLHAFEVRYDIPVVWAPTPEAAARQVETWAWYFSREITVTCNNLFRNAAQEEAQHAARSDDTDTDNGLPF